MWGSWNDFAVVETWVKSLWLLEGQRKDIFMGIEGFYISGWFLDISFFVPLRIVCWKSSNTLFTI